MVNCTAPFGARREIGSCVKLSPTAQVKNDRKFAQTVSREVGRSRFQL